MEYTSIVEINAPLNVVLEYFTDLKYLQEWQPNLKGLKMLKGEPNEEGSQVQLQFLTNGRVMDMTESLTTLNPPHEITKIYVMQGVHQILTSQFEEITENTTKWTTFNKFEFSGFLAAMASVMIESFKKEGAKNLNLFKQFVEQKYGKTEAQ